MKPKCPNPTCESDTFTMSDLKVIGFHATLGAITCMKCGKIVTVLDPQADQELYQNTQKILEVIRAKGDATE